MIAVVLLAALGQLSDPFDAGAQCPEGTGYTETTGDSFVRKCVDAQGKAQGPGAVYEYPGSKLQATGAYLADERVGAWAELAPDDAVATGQYAGGQRAGSGGPLGPKARS